MSPVKYKLGFYIPEDDILHSHRCEYLKFYITLIEMLHRVTGFKMNLITFVLARF
jgi:hypothetical protein